MVVLTRLTPGVGGSVPGAFHARARARLRIRALPRVLASGTARAYTHAAAVVAVALATLLPALLLSHRGAPMWDVPTDRLRVAIRGSVQRSLACCMHTLLRIAVARTAPPAGRTCTCRLRRWVFSALCN